MMKFLLFYRFTECYGTLGLLDRLHGTDLKFRQSADYNRHRMWLSIKPIREIYPELTAVKKTK